MADFEGFGEVSRDFDKFRRIWRSFKRFEKFRGIWRCFKGFQEVLRDLKKFLGISKSFEGFRKLSRDLEKFRGIFDNFIYPKMSNSLHFAFLNFILWKKSEWLDLVYIIELRTFLTKQKIMIIRDFFLCNWFRIQRLILHSQYDKNGCKFDRLSIIPNIFIHRNVRILAVKFNHKI